MIGSYDSYDYIRSYTVDFDLDLPYNSTKIKPEKQQQWWSQRSEQSIKSI
jgi:hypothetical protein